MEFNVTPWDGPHLPREAELRERMNAEGLLPYAWSNGPGFTYSAHTHGFHKVIYVVRGSITWILDGGARELETCAGDRLDLPAGTSHGARVGPQGVTCLEGHRS